MKTNPLRKKLALAVGLSVVILFGAVAYAATSNILAVGTMPHSEVIGGPATLTARQLLIPPGEVGGWHYHPGTLLSVVKRGAVTIEDGCGGEETFTAGQAFEQIGGRVHRAKNLGAEEVEEYNMFVNPQGTLLTVNIPERRCGPPKDVNECTDGGWMNFTHPRSFDSRRDCVQFVRNQLKPGEWMRCADEGGFCDFDGTRRVRYGANGVYAYATFTDGVQCSNEVFGDPLFGVGKACGFEQ